ncbi:MAG: hypothetical protein JKY94_17335 [Rhodobacteraceae bacterium]|nr:hypothetical protein [Paracoccaceae bacterium]
MSTTPHIHDPRHLALFIRLEYHSVTHAVAEGPAIDPVDTRFWRAVEGDEDDVGAIAKDFDAGIIDPRSIDDNYPADWPTLDALGYLEEHNSELIGVYRESFWLRAIDDDDEELPGACALHWFARSRPESEALQNLLRVLDYEPGINETVPTPEQGLVSEILYRALIKKDES